MIPFYKLSGGGNDFLALVEPEAEPTPESVRAWCARGVSLGADGLFTLSRRPHGVRMIHYDADGSRPELCVNGTRCAARLAFHLGWAPGSVTVETDAGEIVASDAGGHEVRLDLPPPADDPRTLTLAVGGQRVEGWLLRVGGPHFVVQCAAGVASAPIESLGPPLRAHADLGPPGANVHFVDYAARDRFDIRSWERGVEGETLACGSGVLAAAAVGLAVDRLTLPASAMTRGGFPLTVEGTVEDGRITRWGLSGDARLLARGELLPGAAERQTPPPW